MCLNYRQNLFRRTRGVFRRRRGVSRTVGDGSGGGGAYQPSDRERQVQRVDPEAEIERREDEKALSHP